RELEHALERLLALGAPQRLGASDARALLAELASPARAALVEASPARAALALAAARGNVSAAARDLGQPRTTYRRRLARERKAACGVDER
ncbi:MAG: helix-turn-helix domain-containing protein, partial [Myxococcota bacterium]